MEVQNFEEWTNFAMWDHVCVGILRLSIDIFQSVFLQSIDN